MEIQKWNVGKHGSIVLCHVENNILKIEIPLEQSYVPPVKKEGSNTINIATVGKPVQVHPEQPIYLGLSLYKYKPR